MALLEAMASGLPVVATRVSGAAEVIEDGRSGILVPPSDSPALAAAMLRVLGDVALAGRLGEEGRRRVAACYTSGVQAEQHVALYRAALSGAHP
jgi:glycosyltransferase involved in cell wall biosynthesis